MYINDTSHIFVDRKQLQNFDLDIRFCLLNIYFVGTQFMKIV